MTIKSTKTSKRGAASLFVVVITIILLGVVTLGFTRLILSEANQITNSDLSQSAYDSALAGVEDAKIALLRYHDCLSRGYTANTSSGDACVNIVKAMQDGIDSRSCDVVSRVLGREQNAEAKDDTGGEVIIQETQSSNKPGSADYMAQAYTCVTIQEDLADYRTTLDGTNRLRIVPIRTSKINNLSKINIQWYSDANASSNGNFSTNVYNDGLPSKSPSVEATAPLISVQFFQADRNFSLSQLSASRDDGHTDMGLLYLKPKANGGTNSIDAKTVAQSTNKAQNNNPVEVSCKAQSPFYCGTDIALPSTFDGGARNEGASFLIIRLPYGAPTTDVSITLEDDGGNTINFTGVQAKIDSTGRANDLYRRVENRVELVDTYFPYPEFTIQMTGDDESSLTKNFWITNNCWSSRNGTASQCDNNGGA